MNIETLDSKDLFTLSRERRVEVIEEGVDLLIAQCYEISEMTEIPFALIF